MTSDTPDYLIQEIVKIWIDARAQSASSPPDRITSIREIPLSDGLRIIAKRYEFYTGNGWVFCFFFDIEDRDLQLAMFQDFSIGSGMTEGMCMEAHLKMMELGFVHSIHLDPVHGLCINVFMSGRLDAFKGPYWIELH